MARKRLGHEFHEFSCEFAAKEFPCSPCSFPWLLSSFPVREIRGAPLAGEFVAEAVQRENPLRLFRVLFEFLPQPGDVDVDRPRVGS